MNRLNALISVFVLLLTLAAPFAMRVWVTADYFINQEVYSNFFCANRAVKDLDCKGRCHLAKSLDTEHDASSIPRIPAETFLSEALPDSTGLNLPHVVFVLLHYSMQIPPKESSPFTGEIDQPPRTNLA
jgi:hypothetical protein